MGRPTGICHGPRRLNHKERKSKYQKIRLSKDQNFNEKKYDIEKHISKVLQSVSSMFQVFNSVQKAVL
jgi:hypothetical protein